MRAPDFGARPVDLYWVALDQCARVDQLDRDCISYLEHRVIAVGDPVISATLPFGI